MSAAPSLLCWLASSSCASCYGSGSGSGCWSGSGSGSGFGSGSVRTEASAACSGSCHSWLGFRPISVSDVLSYSGVIERLTGPLPASIPASLMSPSLLKPRIWMISSAFFIVCGALLHGAFGAFKFEIMMNNEFFECHRGHPRVVVMVTAQTQVCSLLTIRVLETTVQCGPSIPLSHTDKHQRV